MASAFSQLVDGRVRKLHLWTVRNWGAAAADGGHRNAVVAAAVRAGMSYLQESNEMAAAAYDDSFDTDQKLREDSAILAAGA